MVKAVSLNNSKLEVIWLVQCQSQNDYMRVNNQIQNLMLQQGPNDFPQRKTISFKTTNSKSIIRIQKSKLLPSNFFKHLTIQVETPKPINDSHEEIIATPCFGMHGEQQYEKISKTKIVEPKFQCDRQEFYSWFSKGGMKPLSSRVQTVPVDMDSSVQKKRHLTERRGRLQRVKSVQEEGSRSTFKMLKKYENLVNEKLKISNKKQSHNKFKLKATCLQGVQNSYKNHFKVNNMKRGYGQIKYKQSKALYSINTEQKLQNQNQGSHFFPLISNG